MRDYGKVSPQFWVGQTGKSIKARGTECQLVALYLLTNPHANMLGLYYVPAIYIAHETGLPLEGASKALQSLSEAGFCAYDEASEFVWVYEMARYQVADSLKENDNRVGGINREYQSLPKNPFLGGFFDKYGQAFHLEVRRDGEGFSVPTEAPSEPLRSQEHEQEHDQEQEQPLSVAPRPSESDDDSDDEQTTTPEDAAPAKPTTGSEAFERWWLTYPHGKRVKKKNAWEVWRRKKLDSRVDELIADVQHRHANDRKWIEGYIPDPERYLKHERWNDEIERPRYQRSQNDEAGDEFLRRIGASNA